MLSRTSSLIVRHPHRRLHSIVPPTPGLYTHYKGGTYDVINTVTHTETDEQLVVYRDPYDITKGFAHPLATFNTTTTNWNNQQVPRFQPTVARKARLSSYAIIGLCSSACVLAGFYDTDVPLRKTIPISAIAGVAWPLTMPFLIFAALCQ